MLTATLISSCWIKLLALHLALLVHQIPNSPEFPPEMRGARVLMLDESGDCKCLAQQLLS
jgi:hypothetical protein